MALVTLASFCKENGIYVDTLYMRLRYYDVKPSWYKIINNKIYVDLTILHQNSDDEKERWIFATNKLYWWLTDWMKLPVQQVARLLAERSKEYTSAQSWQMYMQNQLFMVPSEFEFNETRTRLQEFIIYGTAIVLAYYRDNYANSKCG